MTSFFEFRSPRTGRLAWQKYLVMPGLSDPEKTADAEAKANDALFVKVFKARRKLFFRFMKGRETKYRKLLEGRKPAQVRFEESPADVAFPVCKTGFFSPSVLHLFRQIDALFILLEQCRLTGAISVEEYHQNVQQLDGALHNAFRRVRSAFKNAVAAQAEARASAKPAPQSPPNGGAV